MERMDMHSRNDCLKVLRERYLKAKTRKEKPQVLEAYCVKCRAEREIKDPKKITLKNGKAATTRVRDSECFSMPI